MHTITFHLYFDELKTDSGKRPSINSGKDVMLSKFRNSKHVVTLRKNSQNSCLERATPFATYFL